MSDFEELQKAWQDQGPSDSVKIESDALLKLVRRNHQAMKKLFFENNFLIAVFGAIYVPLWIWLGVSRELPWTWYLHIPAFLWVAGFLIYNRLKKRRQHPKPGDSLRDSVAHSLALITHQIQLQKKVLWWYLLPPYVPMAIFFIHCGILYGNGNPWGAIFNLIIGGLIFWGTYELTLRGVRKQLEPQRDELQEFLASLERTKPEPTE